MKILVETERLLLRELNIDDAESFYKLNLNPKIIQITGNSAFKNVDEARVFLENYTEYAENGYGRWAVIEKSSNQFVGWCGLKYDHQKNETDIGFRFFEEHWNKGFATESAKACLKYGFEELNLKSIVGRAMLENVASIRVLEKIGLKFLMNFDFDENNKGVIYKIDYNSNINRNL